MNISTKTVLAGALLTAVMASTTASAGRAELPTIDNGNVVNTAQKVFLSNTSGGMAEQVIAYNSASVKKVSFKAPVADKEVNR